MMVPSIEEMCLVVAFLSWFVALMFGFARSFAERKAAATSAGASPNAWVIWDSARKAFRILQPMFFVFGMLALCAAMIAGMYVPAAGLYSVDFF